MCLSVASVLSAQSLWAPGGETPNRVLVRGVTTRFSSRPWARIEATNSACLWLLSAARTFRSSWRSFVQRKEPGPGRAAVAVGFSVRWTGALGGRSMIAHVLSADWGKNAAKRAVYVAEVGARRIGR